MTITSILILFILFQFKHFICDFAVPSLPYMNNKTSPEGCPGNVLHAAIHGLGTLIVLSVVQLPFHLPFLIGAIDAIIHFGIDWSNIRMGNDLKLNSSEPSFWMLLGADQLFHQLTYAFLIFVITLF